MDLHSGSLYWPSVSPSAPASASLAPEVECDVLVIGAGVTGAMVAHHMTGIGARVCVVDRRPFLTGSTPASTALLLYEIDTPLFELSDRLGREHAEGAYHASSHAVECMTTLVRTLDNDCDLAERASVQYAPDDNAIDRLAREEAARSHAGLVGHLIGRDELLRRFGIDRPAALVSEPAREVNPGKLTVALLRSAAKRGAILSDRVSVEISPALSGTGPVRMQTSAGGTISASWVVVATGYETPAQCEPVARLTDLICTYALATEPIEGEPWGERALLWEAADPYLYIRTTPDGRIVLGGEDKPFANPNARDALLSEKARTLEAKLRALLPGIVAPTAFAWAGTFASTEDGLPYIGTFPGWPRLLFALGYGGNGITFSLLAAQILADLVGGRSNPHASLFRFDR